MMGDLLIGHLSDALDRILERFAICAYPCHIHAVVRIR
jgi:hypothetical protein